MKMLRTLLALALLAAGCSSSGGGDGKSAATSTATVTVTVTGKIITAGVASYRQDNPAGSLCWTLGNAPNNSIPGPLDDIRAGDQVTVTDASGQTLGYGEVKPGATTRRSVNLSTPPCAFPFTVAGVPGGQESYGIKVGTHSKQIPGSTLAAPAITFA